MSIYLHTPTPDLQKSIDFYTNLGWVRVDKTKHFFCDGNISIEINPDRYARAGFKIFRQDWTAVVEKLSTLTHVVQTADGYVLSDPAGVWIYLVSAGDPGMHASPVSGKAVLGNYAGLSLEAVDLERAVALYECLGFAVTQGTAASGFVSLSLNGFDVSFMKPLMCPHLFFNPSMTYFNGKINNPIIIEKVRLLGIPITEEITHFNPDGIVDNIIIRDPGGFGFFVFND